MFSRGYQQVFMCLFRPGGTDRACIFGLVLMAIILAAASSFRPVSARSTTPTSLTVSCPRVVVLKSHRILHLFDGDQLVRSYAIDLGTRPIGPKTRDKDGRTPEGLFRIATRNPNGTYGRFLGISYPDVAAARRGVAEGYLSPGEADQIYEAHRTGVCPPWTTALGGGLGLHGGGRGTDWTAGCIALKDADMEELFTVLRVGDPVEILP